MILLIVVGAVTADTEPSEFAGTYQLTRTDMETGEEFTEELRIYDYDDHLMLEQIQGGGGGELIEQWGVEYQGWMAACDTFDQGVIGLYRLDGEGITGVEFFISDTTFYTIKSDDAQALVLKPQWARGYYSSSGMRYSDSYTYEGVMILTGTDSMWQAADYVSDTIQITGYGLSAENAVALLFKQDDRFTVFKVYVITGGNLEGEWMSLFRDYQNELRIHTGCEELFVQKIHE